MQGQPATTCLHQNADVACGQVDACKLRCGLAITGACSRRAVRQPSREAEMQDSSASAGCSNPLCWASVGQAKAAALLLLLLLLYYTRVYQEK